MQNANNGDLIQTGPDKVRKSENVQDIATAPRNAPDFAEPTPV